MHRPAARLQRCHVICASLRTTPLQHARFRDACAACRWSTWRAAAPAASGMGLAAAPLRCASTATSLATAHGSAVGRLCATSVAKQATTRITAPILKSRRCTAAVPVVREATFSGIALCTRPHPHHLVCLVSLPLRPTSSRALAAVALAPGFLASASRAAGSVSQMTGDRPWCLLLQQQNV